MVVGCGLLVVLSAPAAQARPRLEGHPKPPSQAEINAAENQCGSTRRRSAPGRAGCPPAARSWAGCTQAEVLIERYDQAQVDKQRAASAYKVTEARLRQAEQQQAASRLRVARLAAGRFESGGGFSPVMVMLGDADGPQVNAPYTGAFVRIDGMYQLGGLIGAVRPAG